MFTGIVEEIGHIVSVQRHAFSQIITISASDILGGTNIGDSIAVSGVCLTVTSIGSKQFSADVMHETINKSSLGNLRAGMAVNLERAMPANGRFGGHIVSGHIDGVGRITKISKDDNAVWYTINAGKEISITYYSCRLVDINNIFTAARQHRIVLYNSFNTNHYG